jgi:hypothetical protein
MLAVFISGGLVGAFGHRLYTVRSVDAAPPRRSPAEFRQRYINEMRGRLSLDDGQAAKLSEVLDRTRARFREFNEKHKTELSGIQDEQVREIQSLLRPDQQDRYEAFRKEREKSICVLLLEPVDTSFGIDELLTSGEERMAVSTNFDADVTLVG